MKIPIFTRFTTLNFLCISAITLLLGCTLASFLVQATAERAWKDSAWCMALSGGLALCLVLFLLLRTHAQSLAEMVQPEFAVHRHPRRAEPLCLLG
jgi:ABC-type Mn2+/Zn2+ transport system permease subunit